MFKLKKRFAVTFQTTFKGPNTSILVYTYIDIKCHGALVFDFIRLYKEGGSVHEAQVFDFIRLYKDGGGVCETVEDDTIGRLINPLTIADESVSLVSQSGNGLKFKADLQLVAVIVAVVSPDIQTVAPIEEGCAIGNVYSMVVYRGSFARGVPNSSAETQRNVWATTFVAVPAAIVSN